ncbi:CHAT domain-containing protein [Nonomuraea sp. 10N515B]|uniref:CHAT domain-containing protein n=1 Tax=Nonomuraea sp. 10N515B TaxID=3457422 RepID=UPI003FCD9CD1
MNPEVHIARFLQTRDLRELESGIAAYHREIARDPDPLLLTGLGNAMSMRFDALGQEQDLTEAITLHRRAVAALAGKPGLAEAQAGLATVLGNHRHIAGHHLDEVLQLYASALRGDLVDRPLVLANHGMALVLGYQITGDRRHLLDGIDALRVSVRATDPAHAAYLWRLAKLASTLVMANDDPDRAAELKEALHVIRERYAQAPEPVKQEIQLLVGALLHADEIPVLPPEQWEQIRRSMAGHLPSGPQARRRFLAGLGGMLIEDVRRSGRLERADQAAELLRRAVAQTPPGYPQLAELYIGLGAVLGLRMEFSGTYEDLDEMIDALRRGVAAARPGDDNAGMYHSDLGNGLMLKFRLGGGLTVLNEAIACYRRALAVSPDHPERAMAYTSLGSALFFRYDLTGKAPDLDEAIDSHRTATSLTAPEHANYALYLANLGGALEQRYKVTRRGEDSEEAAKVLREAVAATPETSPYRPGHLANLAEMLLERYRFTGQSAAREEADELLREAMGTIQPGNIQGPLVLNSLGTVLMEGEEDIDGAIGVFRRARDAAPARTWTRTLATVNLANALLLRSTSKETPKAQLAAITRLLDPAAEKGMWRKLLRGDRRVEETPDLDEAVALFTEAIKADPPGGPVAYNGLGLALSTRYGLTGKPRTLLQAVRAARTAVETSAPGDSTRSIALYYLAEVLVEQWELTRAEADRDEALARFREATQVETASAGWRASVGKRWGEVAMEAGLAVEAVEGFAVAVAALDEAAWRGLGRADQERILGEYESLARDAAAAAIRTGDTGRALELLEQGRGVMFAQVIGDRAAYDRLRAAAPELADRFGEVQDELDAAERMDLNEDLALSGGSGGPGTLGMAGGPSADRRRLLDHRYTLARRRREILEAIRKLPGLTDFLRPPHADGLLAAAEDGPVAVVNVSRHGCDALLVTSEGVRVVPLDFTASAAQDQADRFVAALRGKAVDEVTSCLDWLWAHVTGPVLEALGPLRRIWWCPTGPLTLLPLHAAGSALDLVVSSYTPTLRALMHARGQSGPRAERRVLLVGVPEVPGDAALKGVVRELEAARRWLPGARELTADDATCEQVLSALDDTAWVHFACHAAQRLHDPSHARLILHDRPLTVRELAARRLGQAELAFLSGCETSRGGTVLTDEAVSIASAIQLAGFPHVIGTLWPIADVHAPAVVDAVYAMLTAGGTREPHPHGAAAALHAAVRSLRDRRPGFPIFWAPYVHIGP